MNKYQFLLDIAIVSIIFLSSNRSWGQPNVCLEQLDTSLITIPWGQPQINQSVGKNVLQINEQSYSRGLGLHAACKFWIETRGATRFSGAVGIDDESLGTVASAQMTIYGDGALLWESPVFKAGQPANRFDLDISSIQKILIEISDGGDGINSDHIDIVDAIFEVNGNPPRLIETPLPPDRWILGQKHDIEWNVAHEERLPHQDFIELSGRKVSFVLTYQVNPDKTLEINRRLIWPALRTIPNDTHASLIHDFPKELFYKIESNGNSILPETVNQIIIHGLVTIRSTLTNGLHMERLLMPSMNKGYVVEIVRITNPTKDSVTLTFTPPHYEYKTASEKGVYGSYVLDILADFEPSITLLPGADHTCSLFFRGRKLNELPEQGNAQQELQVRQQYVNSLFESLILECPDPIITQTFNFTKLRGTESVFQTQGGYMFAPGGERYYAAIWANDNAEYQGPFAPFIGDYYANEAALNAYRHFARFMNNEFKPIPSSIIAEGVSIWNGAGDRGDAAMIAYGAARYALARGSQDVARELWPLIKWCLEYCQRQKNTQGVIASDCDELEHRFPAGKANLCTSALAYDAYRSAAMLANTLHLNSYISDKYQQEANALKENIIRYFAAEVEGFQTWQYYEGNTVLRAWICIPLTTGITDRMDGTLAALFSPRLWTRNGLATQAGARTFWDRSTLYALRGVFTVGKTDLGLEKFHYYSERRLLGEHVPYPVEAWPEGNQRHLAAESALYCRVITEGLFGIRPTGFGQFECAPYLPSSWDKMALKHIKLFDRDFDIVSERTSDGFAVTIQSPQQPPVVYRWNGTTPLKITLDQHGLLDK